MTILDSEAGTELSVLFKLAHLAFVYFTTIVSY